MTAAGDGHWFEPLADHLGDAYLRYSFTKGTVQEVDALEAWLGLGPGARVLDVGCGPGRHALELGRRGYEVVGVDISERFVELGNASAPANVTFARADARALTFDGEFDAVISLCQGAFGLSGGPAADDHVVTSALGGAGADPDRLVLRGMARAVVPGGVVGLSAFSAYFQIRYLEDADTFDAGAGVNREVTSVRSSDGAELPCELWTTCFTPRELRLLAADAGLVPEALHSVTPGAYRPDPPSIEQPELFLVARRPALGNAAGGC